MKLHTKDWDRAVKELKARAPVAEARALNRSITSGRAAMVKLIAADLGGVKQATVREELKIQQATPAHTVAKLSASGRRIPLIDFSARGPEPSRGRGRGVTAKLKGGAGLYPRAFIARIGGRRGVFQRVGKARIPVRELRGPSLPHVFTKFLDDGIARAHETMAKNLEREIAHELRQIGKGR